MPSFVSQYRELFKRFGYPLGATHRMESALLSKTAKRLGVTIPEALRDYFTVAGNERRFNRAFQTLLHPSKWIVDQAHLAFLEENQGVCQWGVSVKSRAAKDPAVYQGLDHDDFIEWYKEHDRCSVFISILLHYQAVSGGFQFCASGAAPDDLHRKLKRGWTYAGEGNELWAFSRQNQVVCVLQGGSFPGAPAMMVSAGAKTARDLKAICESLEIELT